jgi:3-oxoacyl-[acyl-carrier-protein] synthase-1
MTTKSKVYITASTSISCAGNTNEELFSNICLGKTGIKNNKNYSSDANPAIGTISSDLSFDENLINQFKNIIKNSDLSNFENTLLIVGSSVGGMVNTENSYFNDNHYKNVDVSKHNIQSIVNTVQEEFKFYDNISFSTACTSSANAIGYGYEVLKKGIYDNVVVLGIDSICHTTVGGFMALGVLSSDVCKPFDSNRDGMNVSEAIACLLLQTKQTENCVEVCGVGYSSDAYHMTQPHPDGSKSAMQNALACANITNSDINYINAHGTGTKANDTSEANSIESLFSMQTKVSSTKSITGHTLGAAGAIEAIISSMVIKKSNNTNKY